VEVRDRLVDSKRKAVSNHNKHAQVAKVGIASYLATLDPADREGEGDIPEGKPNRPGSGRGSGRNRRRLVVGGSGQAAND
jgi:hypothetical protein